MGSESSGRDQLLAQLGRLRDEGVWGLRKMTPPPNMSPPIETTDDGAGDLTGVEGLPGLEDLALACTACRLCEKRTRVVFGAGDPDAKVMFVGEGPGHDEDLQGVPFVGKAGHLLTQIIDAMGLARDRVYIANTVKCRPPGNRNPHEDELLACRHFLLGQVAAVEPQVIVLLGKVAMQAVLELDAPLGRMRGRFHDWQGIPVMCTYHPAYLLRNPADKRKVWEDIQQVMQLLAGNTP